jgi:Putative prokaryotic signal transducing protein
VAELARGYLRAHGIESVLQDTESVTMRGGFPGLGGRDLIVQLQVADSDVTAATGVLAEWELALARSREDRGRPEEERCLQCGAALVPEATRCATCGWTWLTGETVR